ncbi:hypothetical protein FHS95_002543 [Sphingomonas naasensis]|nr:hypothetical protein [Sphingomonas naasensis]
MPANPLTDGNQSYMYKYAVGMPRRTPKNRENPPYAVIYSEFTKAALGGLPVKYL